MFLLHLISKLLEYTVHSKMSNSIHEGSEQGEEALIRYKRKRKEVEESSSSSEEELSIPLLSKKHRADSNSCSSPSSPQVDQETCLIRERLQKANGYVPDPS